jgi:hypothetical protein
MNGRQGKRIPPSGGNAGRRCGNQAHPLRQTSPPVAATQSTHRRHASRLSPAPASQITCEIDALCDFDV